MAGRRVTESPPQAQGPSQHQSRQAGATAAAVEAQPSLHSRQTTATPSSSGRKVPGSGARPYRRAQPAQAPHREPENAETTELTQLFAKRIKLDSASGFTELPWLAPLQNAERRALHDRLTELRQRPEAPSQTEADPDDAVGLVSRFEREVLRADELLNGIHTKLLTEVEWRELNYLVERARSNLPLYRGKVPGMLERLVEGDAMSSAEAALLTRSLQRLVDAHEYLSSEELPWRDVARRVEVPLRAGVGTTAVVESRVTPGTAFGECLASGYSWDDNARPVDKAVSGHVPCLAQTTLTGATGQLLFSGLRQGFISLPGLHQRTLRALSDADLRRLVGAVLFGEKGHQSPGNYENRVDERCRSIRSCLPSAARSSRILQHRCSERMALESAAAAVCADPEKYQRALNGESVDVKLFDVALLAGNDFQPWAGQYAQHCAWQDPRPVRLNLRGPDNEPCPVSANVNVRQFALSVEDPGPDFSGCAGLQACIARLLGPTDTRELKGDVEKRLETLRTRAAQLGREITAPRHERARTVPPGALDHPRDLEARNRVTRLQAELSRVDKNARALEQAARQLKDMWVGQSEWPTGADAYAAASRLALVAYLMGETPVLSCVSGRDFTGHLDAEVKILATVTDCQGGHVPPADLDTAIWDSARTALGPQQEQ